MEISGWFDHFCSHRSIKHRPSGQKIIPLPSTPCLAYKNSLYFDSWISSIQSHLDHPQAPAALLERISKLGFRFKIEAEKGREEGIILGEQRGQLKSAQEMLIEIARDKYGSLPVSLENDILSIQSVSTLKHLGRQFMKLDNPDDFAGLVKKALE